MGFWVMELFPEISDDVGWLSSKSADFDDFSEIAGTGVIEPEEALWYSYHLTN